MLDKLLCLVDRFCDTKPVASTNEAETVFYDFFTTFLEAISVSYTFYEKMAEEIEKKKQNSSKQM